MLNLQQKDTANLERFAGYILLQMIKSQSLSHNSTLDSEFCWYRLIKQPNQQDNGGKITEKYYKTDLKRGLGIYKCCFKIDPKGAQNSLIQNWLYQ